MASLLSKLVRDKSNILEDKGMVGRMASNKGMVGRMASLLSKLMRDKSDKGMVALLVSEEGDKIILQENALVNICASSEIISICSEKVTLKSHAQ